MRNEPADTNIELPKHIAIVMDGNGRWAKKQNLPRREGHRAGAARVREIVTTCVAKGIQVLTLFAFSTENWKRPKTEIDFLMNLFVWFLQKEVKEFMRNNISFRVIGDIKKLSKSVQNSVSQVESLTANNTGLKLVIAVNYSGRWDITAAVRKIGLEVKSGKLKVEDISSEYLQTKICLADLPEPDLFIRTSGEKRLSNFMLWQLAYTELYFSDKLWPDFVTADLEEALASYTMRERRFGGITC